MVVRGQHDVNKDPPGSSPPPGGLVKRAGEDDWRRKGIEQAWQLSPLKHQKHQMVAALAKISTEIQLSIGFEKLNAMVDWRHLP